MVPARISLAVAALIATFTGTLLARVQVARGLYDALDLLVQLKSPRARDLIESLAAVATIERAGEALLALAAVLWVLAAASVVRASRSLTTVGLSLAILGGALAVAFPQSKIPERIALKPPPDEWPEGVVLLDESRWNVFLVISNRQWAARFAEADLGPGGLEKALANRFARGQKRPVKIYFDPRCPPDTREVFAKAVKTVTDPGGVELDEERVASPDDFQAARRRVRELQLEPYRDALVYGSLARVATGVGLAALVWWSDRIRRKRTGAAQAFTAGYLILAFGQVLAVPLALYAGVIPSGVNRTLFAKLIENVLPHLALLGMSAVLQCAGGIAAIIGHSRLADAPDSTENNKRIRATESPLPRPRHTA